MDTNAALFIGSIPEHYDQGLGPILFSEYADDLVRRVVASNPHRILETAAGTGIVTRRLRDALPTEARLTATDLNAPMLEIARKKFRPDEGVALQPADAMALPFADASFDAAVCQFGVMFFPDQDKAHREVFRVLSPGGHHLFNVWDSHRYNPFARIMHEVAGSFFPNDPPQFYSVPFSRHRIDPIKQSLLDAGFTDIIASVITLNMQIPDAAGFARGLVYGNPLIDQVRSRGGVPPERIFEAVVERLHREFGADPGEMPLQAIVFSARKP